MKKEARAKPHYAWAVFISCCMIQGGVVGLIQNSCGIFYQPICKELGFDLSEITFYTSLRVLASCLALPLSSHLLKKVHLRILLTLAVFGFSLSNFCMGTFSALWQWYLAAIVQGVSASFLAFTTTPILLGNWFKRKLGFVIGLSSACSGVFGIFANPFGNWVIETFGWRTAYYILSVLCLILVSPFTLFVVRFSPYEMRMRRLGEDKEASLLRIPRLTDEKTKNGPPGLYLLLLIFLEMVSALAMGFTQLLPSFGLTQNFSPAAAAVLVSCSMAGNMIGKFTLGIASDRFGIHRVSFLAFTLPLSGFALLLAGGRSAYIAAILTGMSMPAAMVIMPILIRHIYGNFRYERVYTIASIIGNIVWALSGPFFGYLYEQNGHYHTGIWLCVVFLIIAVMLIPTVFSKNRRVRPNKT